MEPLSSPAPHKLTYEDYCAIPEDLQRHEVIDGEHFVVASPLDIHQRLSKNLLFSLETYLRRTRAGVLRDAPSDVLLGEHDIVVPDLYVVLAANSGRLQRNGCHGPPDLVIEILSESRPEYDLVRKRRLYERTGVPEYWVVGPAAERVEVYRRVATGNYGRPVVLTVEAGDVLETQLLPGLRIELAEVFGEP